MTDAAAPRPPGPFAGLLRVRPPTASKARTPRSWTARISASERTAGHTTSAPLRATMIDAEPDKIAQVAQAIANLPHVAEVYSVTGDMDIIAVVRLGDYEQLAQVVPEGLSRIPGVLRTNTVLAFRRFSAPDLEAAWDIGVS